MIYWDTETGLIQSGLLAPPLACITYAHEDDEVEIVHGDDPAARRIAEYILSAHHMAANTAYDLAVFAAKWPDLLPRIFEVLDANLSHDVILAEKLCDIGDGCYRTHETESLDGTPQFTSVRYRLSDLHERYCGAPLEKDQFRLSYGKLRHQPLSAWPAGAIQYPKEDTAALRRIHQLQLRKDRRVPVEQYLVNEPAQSRAAFAYHLVSCWGFMTDCEEVRRFMRQIEQEQEIRREQLIAWGLVRQTGQRNKKAAIELMRAVMGDHCTLTKKGVEIYRAWWGETQKTKLPILPEQRRDVKLQLFAEGYVSLAGDVCLGSGNKTLQAYAEYGSHQTLYSKVRALDAGGMPVQTSFEPLLETGRVSSFASKIIPNSAALLNLPRKPGMRECLVPRNWQVELPLELRHVLLAADYGMAELVSLAQVCFTMFGHSALRDVLNAGRDPHLELASDFAGITYEEAKLLHQGGDERIDALRTLSKAANFGFMGGLGAESFVEFASKVYRVSFADTFEESCEMVRGYKRVYYHRYPEIKLYHARIGEMCELGGGVTSIRQFLSNRLRGNIRYTVAANSFVQGLTADAFKQALWEIQKRCYVGERMDNGRYRETALLGARVVAPVHDEIVLDVREAIAHEAALELQQVMINEYRKFTPDVHIGVEAAMMRRWRKKAKPVHNEMGRLIPYEDRKQLAA